MRSSVIFGLLGAAVFLSGCNSVVKRNLYPGASGAVRIEPRKGLNPAERSFLRSDGEERQYFWIDHPAEKGTILYLHGNNETARSAHRKTGLERLPYDVFLLEYTGYGRNSGTPSEPEFRADLRNAIMQIRLMQPEKPLYLVGSSLGANLAIIGERDVVVDGMLTISPFTEVKDFAPDWARFLVSENNEFDARERAPNVRVPWVITHCNGDRTTPSTMSHQLYRASQALGPNANVQMNIYSCADHPVKIDHWAQSFAQLEAMVETERAAAQAEEQALAETEGTIAPEEATSGDPAQTPL